MNKFSQVDPLVYRSSQPLTQDDFEYLLKVGIEVVIDLENESGESPWEKAQWKMYSEKVDFNSVPLSGFWAPKKEDMQNIASIIDSARFSNEKVLIHCKHGRDRTGLAVGEYRRSRGWKKGDAWHEMLDQGYHWILLGLSWYWLLN